MEERIATLDDPRLLGSALTGDHAGYWRWRIGDYRVVARIEDERIVIIVVRVAARGLSVRAIVVAVAMPVTLIKRIF